MDSWLLVGVSFELMNLGFLSFSSLSSFLIASLFCLLFLSPYFPFILFFLSFLLPSYCLFTFSSFSFFLIASLFFLPLLLLPSCMLFICLVFLLFSPSFFITFVFFLPLLLRSCMLLVRLAFHRFKVCVCVCVCAFGENTYTTRLLQVDIHKLGWYTQFGLRYTRFGGMCALIGGGAHGLDR